MWHILQMSVSSLVLMMATGYVIKHVIPGPVTESPVTPNAPPPALTTAFACSIAWSIIIGENCRFKHTNISVQNA